MSDEERRMGKQEDLESEHVERVHDDFRGLRRRAPEEAKVRLVLPHSFIRIVRHQQFGERRQKRLFLPTSPSDSLEDSEVPTSLDYDRLWTFIDTTSRLLGEGADHEAARFTLSDFTFEAIPSTALFGHLFNGKELKEFLKAGREAFELYGLSARQFIGTYLD